MTPVPDCSSSSSRPPPALPQAPPRLSSLHSPSTPPPADRSAAELALLLAHALQDADALKRDLATEQARAHRLDSELSLLSSSSIPLSKDGSSDSDRLARILDAEARADRAERARDDALAALTTIKAAFADLDRYEDLLAVRAADARFAFAQSLAVLSHRQLFPPPSLHPRSPHTHAGGAGAGGREAGAASAVAFALPPLPDPHTGAGPHELAHAHALAAHPGPPIPAAPSGARVSGHGHPLAPSSDSTTAGAGPSVSRTASTGGTQVVGTNKADGSLARGGAIPGPFSSLAQNLPPPPSATTSMPTGTKRRRLEWGLREDGHDRDRGRGAEWDEQDSRRYNHEDDHGLANSAAAATAQRAVGHPAHPLGRMDARQLVRESKERRLGLQTSTSTRLRSSHSHTQTNVKLNGHGSDMGAKPGHKRSRSGSRSSTGSMSLDELLLESATDARAPLASQNLTLTIDAAPHRTSENVHNPDAPIRNGVSSGVVNAEGGEKEGTTSSTTAGGSQKVPASHLVTLGPSGSTISGGGSTVAPAFPSHNEQGLRLCRQCGAVGRYKDRRCVEKWGPGPYGPGTVCDRCRKKTKRDELRERRNSMSAAAAISIDNSASTLQQVVHTPSYAPASHQSYARRHRSPHALSDRDVSRSRDASPVSAASAAARNGLGRDNSKDVNSNVSPYARHQHSASLPGQGHLPVTYRSPSPDRHRPAISLAVSSERGGASAGEGFTDEDNNPNSRSSTPHNGLDVGTHTQYATTISSRDRRRLPSSPPVDSIPTHAQRRFTGPTGSSTHEADANGDGDVDMDMHSDVDVDAAFLSAAASSPEVGTATARKRHRRSSPGCSPSPSAVLTVQEMLSAASPAKYQRKRDKATNISVDALSGLSGPGQSQNQTQPPSSASVGFTKGKLGSDGDTGFDVDADGEVDADAEGSADADLLEAAS